MKYINEIFSEERALYGIKSAELKGCSFEGEEDGESALKETNYLSIKDCRFLLRYPMWHMKNSTLENCFMGESCRAALWYDSNINIRGCKLNGIKALRECSGVTISDSVINSTEFGWFCDKLIIENSVITTEYPFLQSHGIVMDKVELKGKYSFQYARNLEISNCIIDTKDAFWHANNVTVRDSVIKGEYLGWYSDKLTLVRCKIIGTQPFCYCDNLILDNCEMTDTDLSFEKSNVKAEVKGSIVSVKNPGNGYIRADEIGEIILDGDGNSCKIEIRNSI